MALKLRFKLLFAAFAFIALMVGLSHAWLKPLGDKAAQPAIIASADAATVPKLPLRPADWHGAADYRALDARIRRMMDDPAMAGLAVATVENGRLAFVQGYGVADRATGEPVTTYTVFRWASLSKGVAATLAAELADEGTIGWDTPIASYGTSLRLPDGAERVVTITDVLSHQLGLPRNAFDGRLEGGDDPAMLRLSFASIGRQCEPRKCHSYQNVAYDTIHEVIENATGKKYGALVEARLFEPLGMDGASVGRDGLVGAESWARPYRGAQELEVEPTYYRVPAAAGVNSTILDLATWMEAQMGLMPDVLPVPLIENLHRPRISTGRSYGPDHSLLSPAYGLGWRSFVYEGDWLVGHSGAVNGYRSSMLFDPATRTGIVLLWNSSSGRPWRIPNEFFDMVRGRESRNWLQLKDEPKPVDPKQIAAIRHDGASGD